jgi:hypothetical protein
MRDSMGYERFCKAVHNTNDAPQFFDDTYISDDEPAKFDELAQRRGRRPMPPHLMTTE